MRCDTILAVAWQLLEKVLTSLPDKGLVLQRAEELSALLQTLNFADIWADANDCFATS